MDIHNYAKRLEKTLDNVKKSNISKKNKEDIIKFHDSCFSEGIGVAKVERYVYDVQRLAKMLNKDLSTATKDDLKSVLANIEKNNWSPHSKHTFKVMLKKFYRWAEGIDEKGVYPDKVRWIKTGVKNSQTKLPEELITEEEIYSMISATKNVRDRAYMAFLGESGCRIGEVAGLRIKDIVFDQHGALVTVSGKTGSRRIRVVGSAPYLSDWINKHPSNQDSNSYLWINSYNLKTLGYNRMCDIIKRLGEKVGITKRIYPHLFRHSRATLLAKNITESQMKSYMGWTGSSRMASIYVHLSGRDTDEAILGLNGIQIEEKSKTQTIKPKKCLRCSKVNEYNNRFCNVCGFILDKEESTKLIKAELEKTKYNDIMDNLLQDKEVLELLAKKIKENSLLNV